MDGQNRRWRKQVDEGMWAVLRRNLLVKREASVAAAAASSCGLWKVRTSIRRRMLSLFPHIFHIDDLSHKIREIPRIVEGLRTVYRGVCCSSCTFSTPPYLLEDAVDTTRPPSDR